jgi:hypothetical protein
MTFGRTVVLGTFAWVAGITFLHAWLNWGLFEPAQPRSAERKPFKIGYLPVT